MQSVKLMTVFEYDEAVSFRKLLKKLNLTELEHQLKNEDAHEVIGAAKKIISELRQNIPPREIFNQFMADDPDSELSEIAITVILSIDEARSMASFLRKSNINDYERILENTKDAKNASHAARAVTDALDWWGANVDLPMR